MAKTINLSTGTEVEFDESAPITLYEILISEILIPRYKENADWNLTLNIVIEEMNRLITEYGLKPALKLELLNQIEKHLDKDIEELTGVAKIEILFTNMEDYLIEIEKLVSAGLDKNEFRHQMAKMIQPLTLFELAELFIFIGKKAFIK